jgi:hypothetical protein
MRCVVSVGAGLSTVAAVLKSGEGVAGFRESARESAPIELQRRWVEGNGVGRLQHDLCLD